MAEGLVPKTSRYWFESSHSHKEWETFKMTTEEFKDLWRIETIESLVESLKEQIKGGFLFGELIDWESEDEKLLAAYYLGYKHSERSKGL